MNTAAAAMKEAPQDDDDELKTKLSLLRASVHNQDPSCKFQDQEMDDSTLRRFLRARDLDVNKASEMLIKYITWRKTFVPKGYISTSEVPNQIAQNKMFMQGKDKQGRPVAVLFGSRHFSCKGGMDEFKRYLAFVLDKLSSAIPEGQEKFTIIGDLQGYGYSNSDIRGTLAAISILQDYYPERLGKVFVVHVPYIFMTLWKIICPFIDKNTRKKIVFVENNKLHETLLEDIEKSQLPEIYGGELPLVPIHNC
ncbi:uncharacterized protein LOC127263066 isoform X1 [Andrographis paniculata]|uniref:uncharacterized protein LOC127263066 isoform X1 n=1 Tax=Andrographis paniculata TaxID=175694 RepID=UPI0021E7B0B0|nr:uncharacterized protein LOC127263066 isoform X1 [Andrographis paniculata]